MILVVFHTAGINEKKNIYHEKKEKKKSMQNLKWATAHLSRRLGAGLGVAAGWVLGWACWALG